MDGCIASAKTGSHVRRVFELCAAAADKGGTEKVGAVPPMPATSATAVRKLRRPTSLRLNEEATTTGPGAATLSTTLLGPSSSSLISHRPAATAQRQKQLRLGVSSLIIGSSSCSPQQLVQPTGYNISRQQQHATSPFAPYSPQARNASSLLALNSSVLRLHQFRHDHSNNNSSSGKYLFSSFICIFVLFFCLCRPSEANLQFYANPAAAPQQGMTCPCRLERCRI